MPHALLLSPDDQAVTAITDVLQELAVTCERPLDGVSAAQKLNSQSFDLVLVDCENLPAAKLIFDVCRRGKNGVNPVPIAIVDGRAGLPTAFRLGAELILTKPVSKDQARSTIRTAVSRVRKGVHGGDAAPAHPDSVPANLPTNDLPATVSAPATPEMTMTSAPPTTEMRARAAAAGAGSSGSETVVAASPAAEKYPSSVRETGVPSTFSKSTVPSDDPVLAELEQTELEESGKPKSPRAETQPKEAESKKPGSAAASVSANPPAPKSNAPLFSSHPSRNKTQGPLVASLMLAVACGGFYAAWIYQPGFQAIVQPQIDRVLGLAGMAPTAKAPVKPANPPAPSKAPAPVAQTDSNPSQMAPPVSANSAASSPGAATAVKPVTGKLAGVTPADSKIDAASALTNTPLPDEKTTIVLSSKGAETRLSYSPPPKLPAGTHAGSAEGTVVLKAVVDNQGKVEGLRLVEGNATLATAAIEAVKQWRYRPYLRDGKAQPFQTVVIVDFSR
jgi:protein TonB